MKAHGSRNNEIGGPKVEPQAAIVCHDGRMRAEKGLSADLLVGQKVLYEIKPVECVGPTMHKSSRTFMRFTQVNVALVVNSHEVFLEDEIERPVLGPENYLFPQPTQ